MSGFPGRALAWTRFAAPISAARARLGGGRLSWVDRRNREYDRQTVEIIRRTLRNDSNAVDAGAHQGLFLGEMLRAAPKGTHHAFEPIPALAQRLRARFPAATVHQTALSDHDGEMTFRYLPEDAAVSSLYARPEREEGHAVIRLSVPVRRLDTVLGPDARVDFIKVDVEDAERDLLRGGMELLTRCRPVVVVECHADHVGELAEILVEAQLSLFLVADFLAGQRRPPQETVRLAKQRAEFYFVAAP